MPYQCPVCGNIVKSSLAEYIKHTEKHIVDEIKKDHPRWAEKNGVCPKCLEYYRKQIKGEESE